MNVNDLIVQGAEPLLFLDYLGLSKCDPADTVAMIEGVAKGCEIAGCALIGGECAEMPDIYAPGDFDIAGFTVGVVELSRAIDPTRVKKGDVVLGLASSGCHSNGYSLVRKIVSRAKLDWKKIYPELQAKGQPERTLVDILLEPTRIYAKPIVRLLQGYKRKKAVSGMAHITGGGLPGNVCRALPDDLDAVIDCTAWTPPPIFPFLQKHGHVDTAEMFKVFNMGIGYVLVVRPKFADAIEEKLRKWGETTFRLGEIVKAPPGAKEGSVRLENLAG
jgi:phosphoribosylformylglycinamidine cyclo-ligase